MGVVIVPARGVHIMQHENVHVQAAKLHHSWLLTIVWQCHLSVACRLIKWHCNDGEVKHVEAVLQAFSHFSNKHMQSGACSEQGVVVDIQGVQQGNTFTLTDPAIHCTSHSRRFGDTNMGQKGIDSFFKSHACNKFCTILGLA